MNNKAIEFAEWIVKFNWHIVHSVELKKYAYVNARSTNILTHGSDYHYTRLIKEHGKTTAELYTLFLQDFTKQEVTDKTAEGKNTKNI